ncbi:haloacid dehalogenase-like hydrolase [Chondromyces apiculatus]|nr:haloacid dehalogenase-like hydrolase [Chondromyces apiculatus]
MKRLSPGRALLVLLPALSLVPLLCRCGGDDPAKPATTGTGGTGGGAGGAGGAGSTSSGTAGGNPDGGVEVLPDLDPALAWYGQNRQRLDAFIDAHGRNDPGYDPARRPVAVFDWDNTVIKNDVGDATMFWMLRHDLIRQPAGKNWRLTSPYLTAAARTALDVACGALVDAGQPLPTSTSSACADAILSIYVDGTTTGGAAAFEGYNHRWISPGYAWLAQLQAGYLPAEIRSFADAAITEALAADLGATHTIGTRTGLAATLRIYDQIRDLIGVMQENGLDVWVVSASPQFVVEPFAERVGIAADHVVGIRQVTGGDGRLTANLQGCGSVPDGQNDGSGNVTGNALITYIEGKRCWINKVIYGDTGPNALTKTADPAKRQVFGAGDSDTDVTFLQDATAMKLVVNRNKKEIMCNGYRNLGDRWLVNPMFIAPRPRYDAGYACATNACVDASGAGAPCLDEEGQVIPEQVDSVY